MEFRHCVHELMLAFSQRFVRKLLERESRRQRIDLITRTQGGGVLSHVNLSAFPAVNHPAHPQKTREFPSGFPFFNK